MCAIMLYTLLHRFSKTQLIKILQLTLMFSPTSAIALKDSAVLGELRLGLCSIGLEGVTKLTETLKTIRTLQVLDISGSTVGLTAGKNLGRYYGHN